jgi:hypothetical protein
MSSDSIVLSETGAARCWLLDKPYGLTTIDHRRLGTLYILVAPAFLVICGIEDTIMRIQQIDMLSKLGQGSAFWSASSCCIRLVLNPIQKLTTRTNG